MSPSSPEIKSEQRVQTPKIFKTYIDFKKTLSEDESENFFRFVKEAIKDFQQPIHDLEAWLASKTKAGQNRWEVYYQKYQLSKKVRKAESKSNSVSESIKQKAIAKHQEYLKQQKSGYEKIERSRGKEKDDLESLLNNPNNQIKSIERFKNQHKPTPKALGKYIAEGKEKLRDLRMTSYFVDSRAQGGLT